MSARTKRQRGTVYERGGKLYLSFYDAAGKRTQRSTGLKVGQEKRAAELLAQVDGVVAEGLAPVLEAETMASYSAKWLDRRRGRVVSVDNEDARFRMHVLPVIGHMRIDEVKGRHVRDLIIGLRNAKRLAPRTIRSINAAMRTMFRDAIFEELVPTNPCALPAGVLPPMADKDPAWRATAHYTRDEVETMISDERVPIDRRVLYAIKFLAGVRHGEAAGLTWERYDATAEPLGRLSIAMSYDRPGTKTGVSRAVPVHPTLAAVLGAWKLGGWEAHYGRAPRPTDPIVPTVRFTLRSKELARDGLVIDLKNLGLRHRRGHDMRRTMISLAQTDGAARHILGVATHGASTATIMDAYSTFSWATICAEVAKLRVSLRTGKVLEMRQSAAAVTAPVSLGARAVEGRDLPGLPPMTPPGHQPG